MRRVILALLAAFLIAAGEPGRDGIVTWCGGGVTGGGGGLHVAPEGAVTRIRRAQAAAPLEETRVPEHRADFARLAAMLDAAGFVRMPRGEPSNMTCSLTRRDGTRTSEVLWPIGQPPAGLRPILQELETLR
jgi:hypothetical protein